MSPLTVSFTNLGWIEEQGAMSGTGSMSAAQPTIRHTADLGRGGLDHPIRPAPVMPSASSVAVIRLTPSVPGPNCRLKPPGRNGG